MRSTPHTPQQAMHAHVRQCDYAGCSAAGGVNPASARTYGVPFPCLGPFRSSCIPTTPTLPAPQTRTLFPHPSPLQLCPFLRHREYEPLCRNTAIVLRVPCGLVDFAIQEAQVKCGGIYDATCW
jgi:hypothetical protein